MTHGALNLGHLARIENKLIEEFNFPSFHSMGQGHFLDFLLNCDEIKKVINCIVACNVFKSIICVAL